MRDFLNKELFNIEGYAFEVHTLITFIVFMAVVMGVLSLLKRITYSSKKLADRMTIGVSLPLIARQIS